MTCSYRALSVKQPFANLIRDGLKTIETRRWGIDYRGDLLIVSCRRPHIEPAGCAVALVRLADCRPMRSSDWTPACCDPYPGAWAWCLENPRPLPQPVPVRGQLRLYTLTFPEPLL